jgi:hypothetical protein
LSKASRVYSPLSSSPGWHGPDASRLAPPFKYRGGWPRLPLLTLDIGTQKI